MKNHENNNIETWTEAKVKRRTLIAFAVYAAAGATGIGAWKYFRALPDTENGLSGTARKILSFDENVNNLIFGPQNLAPTYPKSMAAKSPRVNSGIGIDNDIVLSEWRLELLDPNTNQTQSLTIDDIKALPKQEIIFDFKCVEGWNEIVHYGGVKLSDVMKKYNIGLKTGTNDWFKYVGMETPDEDYYVGLDMKSALHPQTLICYEMNGEALSVDHGAPLRLIIPLKYGIKNLKCIGKIFCSDTPPRDYWYERGYVYDAAL